MLQELMEKLTTALAAYEPNPAWTVDLFIILLAAIIIGFILNNLYKQPVISYLGFVGAAFSTAVYKMKDFIPCQPTLFKLVLHA